MYLFDGETRIDMELRRCWTNKDVGGGCGDIVPDNRLKRNSDCLLLLDVLKAVGLAVRFFGPCLGLTV